MKTIAQEIIEVLAFGFACYIGIKKSLGDGDINLMDTPNLIPIAISAGPAFEGISGIAERWDEADESTKQEVFAYVDSNFPDLENDQKEELVKETIKEVLGDVNVALKWARYIKRDEVLLPDTLEPYFPEAEELDQAEDALMD